MHEEPALKVGGETMSATRRNPEGNMDVIVTAAERGAVWQLTDLLGRSMGSITKSGANQFTICRGGPRLGNDGRNAERAACLARCGPDRDRKAHPGHLPARVWRRA